MLDKIKSILDEYLVYEGSITESTRIADDLGADSFDIPMLVSKIEDEFGIEIKDYELPQIKTIGDIMNIVERELN